MSTYIVESPTELLSLVGTTLGPSEPLVIEQERINQFADATGDHQWIHVDPEKAKDGPFGSTIAHGYLTLSLANWFLPQLLQVNNVSMGVNYGAESIRFPSTVPVNSTVRATGEITSAEEAKGGVKVVVRITITVEGAERPACIVDTISIFYP
ncbi:MAG: MaoC family dehydratase [Halieaceae bacterium]|nr:MaoC family dehydratase [Halieaceae bacterium]